MENGHEPSVTLEDSSDEEGRGNTNGPLPSEHESFGQVSSDLKALVGGRAMEPARRNGRVSIPQQSAVFGCFPQVKASILCDSNVSSRRQKAYTIYQATGQGSGLVAASTGNPLLRKRGGDIFSNHSNITAANNRKTKYSAIGNCVVGGSSDLIASGESLLIDKSKLLSNAAAYTKLVVSQCPEHKR